LVATTAGGRRQHSIPAVPDAEAIWVARTTVPSLLEQLHTDRADEASTG
jgi:hypothetical protein